jgi:hypothetical protein
MGITIAYQGKLSDPGRVDEMVREVQALAAHMRWRTWTVAELEAQGHIKATGLRGVTVSVALQCEPVHFHVDGEGRFVNHSYYSYIHSAEEREMFVEAMRHMIGVLPASTKKPGPELDAFLAEGVGYNWTKTQHGGPAAHVQACNLIRFVRDRFAPALQVMDDTGYFEHGRLEELSSQMGLIDRAIHLARRAAERISQEGEVSSIQGLLDKLQRYMDEERDLLH